MKIVGSTLFKVNISKTASGYAADILYQTNNPDVPFKKVITLFAETRQALHTIIEEYITSTPFLENPLFRNKVLKEDGVPPDIAEFLDMFATLNNSPKPKPESIKQLTVLTTYHGQLPQHIETFKEANNDMHIVCSGCHTCPGTPCHPCDTIISEIVEAYGLDNYLIHIEQVATPMELSKVEASLTPPVLILNDALQRPDAPQSELFKFEGREVHDVVFDTIDATGKPFKAMFSNCITLTDYAGDEVLHLHTNQTENSIEYLTTPHPDSKHTAELLIMYVSSQNQKSNTKVMVKDYNEMMKTTIRR